jgi:MFS family permease
MLTPQNTGLIQEMFEGEERGRAFGIFGTTVGVSAAAGPILGGLLIAAFGAESGWRAVFWVNVPVGAVAMLLAARVLPAGRRETGSLRSRIDFVGAGRLGADVLCVLLRPVGPPVDPATWWWLLAPFTLVLGVLFVRWERRQLRHGRAPLLDVRLFSEVPGYLSGIGIGTVYFCGFSGIWLVLALFFQDGLGYSALQSGLAVTPFAVGSSVSAVIAGRLVSRFDRRLTVAGLVLVVLGFSALTVVVSFTDGAAAWWMALPLLVAGVGGGAVISPNITLTLDRVPPRMGGAAGGALQTGQRIGSAVGAALLAAVFRISLSTADGRPQTALAWTFGCSVLVMLVTLALALGELRRRRTGRGRWAAVH